MTTVEMVLHAGSGQRWCVRAADADPEFFSCPVQALLRAKYLFQQIPDREAGALMVSFDGNHSTKLISRQPALC